MVRLNVGFIHYMRRFHNQLSIFVYFSVLPFIDKFPKHCWYRKQRLAGFTPSSNLNLTCSRLITFKIHTQP